MAAQDEAALKIAITADGTQAQSVFKNIMGSVTETNAGLAGLGKAAMGALEGFASFAAVGATLKYIVDVSVKAESGTMLLKEAVENAGDGTENLYDQMNKLAESMVKVSGFSNEDLKSALTNLTNTTGSAKVAMEALQPAINLAIAKHMDLASAAQLVGRAYETGTNVLKRYGVVTAENLTGQQALQAISEKYAGTMEAQANTAEGKMKIAKATVEELAVAIGKDLLPIIKELADSIAFAAKWWGDFIDKMRGPQISAVDKAKESYRELNAEIAQLQDREKMFKEKNVSQDMLDKLDVTITRLKIKAETARKEIESAERAEKSNPTFKKHGGSGAPAGVPVPDPPKENEWEKYLKKINLSLDEYEIKTKKAQSLTKGLDDSFSTLGKTIVSTHGDIAKSAAAMAKSALTSILDYYESDLKGFLAVSTAKLVGGDVTRIPAIAEAGIGIAAIEALKGLIGGMATGGIVTRPTATVLGEGGRPEGVIPLDKLQPMINEAVSAAGGGGFTVMITGDVYGVPKEQFYNEITKKFQSKIQSGLLPTGRFTGATS